MKKLLTPLLIATLFSSLNADNVILDDLIVNGSGCFGIDCVNGESFGFDTLRLKENNLRLNFTDTSNSASFPSNDWTITINDSSNGGINKFSIDDIDGGRTPFTIEAGAPSHSLYVDDAGRVGIGTATPVVELHIPDGDTPTVRLEQDGSSGWTPQVWDVAGNETNFFVRDVTNGSKLPFKIIPGSPDNSLYIHPTGVGIGKTNPSVKLDVNGAVNTTDAITASFNGSTSSAAYKMLYLSVNNTNTSKASDVGITMENLKDNFSWSLRTWENTDGFAISKVGNGATKEFKLENTNPTNATTVVLTLGNGASCNGTWNDASSRSLKQDIKLLDGKEALEAFKKLQPVTYAYKAQPNDPKVGFIAEDVPDLVANPQRKSLSSLDIVALLTKVVQEQEKEMTQIRSEILELKLMQQR